MQSIYAHVSIHLFIVNFSICNCALLRLYKRPISNPTGTLEIKGPMMLSAEGALSSSAPAGPWGHSFYTSFTHMTNFLHLRSHRSTLTRYNPGRPLPQVCL